MGQETIISMNYEFNFLGLSIQLVGVEKEAFPMILDAPTLVEIIEEEEKVPWWKKGLSAVGNTLKNAIVPLAIGALVAGAIAIAAVVIVGTGGAGAILVAGAVAAGKAFAIGLAVTAVGATAGVATTAVYEAVTGKECSQAVYDQEAERWAKIAGLVYGAYNIGKLATSIQWTSTGSPMMELAGTGETFGGIASVVGDVDIAGVIEGIQGGVLGGAIWFAKGSTGSPYDADGNYTGGRTEEELAALADDPAHAGSTRQFDVDQGLLERKVGLDLEKRGVLDGPITRDPSGKAKFFDANDQAWDVKSFNSNFKPSKGGFTLQKSMDAIKDSLSKGEYVILDTSNLSTIHKNQLLQELINQGLTDKVIIWP